MPIRIWDNGTGHLGGASDQACADPLTSDDHDDFVGFPHHRVPEVKALTLRHSHRIAASHNPLGGESHQADPVSQQPGARASTHAQRQLAGCTSGRGRCGGIDRDLWVRRQCGSWITSERAHQSAQRDNPRHTIAKPDGADGQEQCERPWPPRRGGLKNWRLSVTT